MYPGHRQLIGEEGEAISNNNESIKTAQVTPTLLLIIGFAGLIIIFQGMRFGAALINTFLLSAIITITIYPAMGWLREKGAPKVLAFIITIFIALTVVALLIFVIAFSIDQFAQVVPTYEKSITSFQKTAKEQLDAIGVNTSKWSWSWS